MKRKSIVRDELERAKLHLDDPVLIVTRFKAHYQCLADSAKRIRKSSALSSTQSSLSQFKKAALAQGCDANWCTGLKLNEDDTQELKKERQNNVISSSINLPLVNGIDQMNYATWLITTLHDPFAALVALCCLTGRRAAEIALSCTFTQVSANPDNDDRHDHWASVSGLLKQRDEDRQLVIPLFAPLPLIQKALKMVREALPKAVCCKTFNACYAGWVSLAVKRYFPDIKKTHDMRKLYGKMAHVHFNKRGLSISMYLSEVLGHKQMSSCILTYMSGVRLGEGDGGDVGVVPWNKKRKLGSSSKLTRSVSA